MCCKSRSLGISPWKKSRRTEAAIIVIYAHEMIIMHPGPEKSFSWFPYVRQLKYHVSKSVVIFFVKFEVSKSCVHNIRQLHSWKVIFSNNFRSVRTPKSNADVCALALRSGIALWNQWNACASAPCFGARETFDHFQRKSRKSSNFVEKTAFFERSYQRFTYILKLVKNAKNRVEKTSEKSIVFYGKIM